ncbi:MAG: hypothetical protein QXH91_08440, partial [Candidatus Bathyarchaeia archaeon]
MRNGVILLIPFLLLTIMANSIVAREFKIISQFTQTPPVIDGKIGGPYSAPIPASQEAELIPDGEWASAQSVLLGGSSAGTKVNVYFLNDEKYLYVSFDFSEGQNNIAQIIIGKEKYSLSFLFDGYQLHYGLLSP